MLSLSHSHTHTHTHVPEPYVVLALPRVVARPPTEAVTVVAALLPIALATALVSTDSDGEAKVVVLGWNGEVLSFVTLVRVIAAVVVDETASAPDVSGVAVEVVVSAIVVVVVPQPLHVKSHLPRAAPPHKRFMNKYWHWSNEY